MSRLKIVAVFIAVVLILGLLAAGGAYLAASSKQKKASSELKTAKDLLENDKTEPAIALLKEHIAKYPRMNTTPEATFLLARTLWEWKEDHEEALPLFERLIREHPGAPYGRQALYYKALALLDKRPYDEETRDFFQELREDASVKHLAFIARYGLALADLDSGSEKKAASALEDLLERSLPDELRDRIEITLGELNLRLLFSPALRPDQEYYTIKRGDYIYKLAKKFRVTQELLMKCNNISDPKKLSIGQRIKIPDIDLSIHVDKYSNTLTLMNHGKFFKKYVVRTGAYEGQTPVGEFKIQNKKKNPRWVNPRTHKLYPPGDPQNELGTRWMSFQNDMLGIHGTIKPETVGFYSSFGCIGMYRKDVEELFDLVPVGTPIKIVGKMNPGLVEESEALGYRE